jgi:hypothetical protein
MTITFDIFSTNDQETPIAVVDAATARDALDEWAAAGGISEQCSFATRHTLRILGLHPHESVLVRRTPYSLERYLARPQSERQIPETYGEGDEPGFGATSEYAESETGGWGSTSRELAFWIPRAYRAKRGYLIAEDRILARDITSREAQEQFPDHHVCYDRDGLYRYRETLAANGIEVDFS